MLAIAQCEQCHESRKRCTHARPCGPCMKKGLECVERPQKRKGPVSDITGKEIVGGAVMSGPVGMQRQGEGEGLVAVMGLR